MEFELSLKSKIKDYLMMNYNISFINDDIEVHLYDVILDELFSIIKTEIIEYLP